MTRIARTAVLVLAVFLSAAWFIEPKTQSRLLLSEETARPGDTIWAGLLLDMPTGWHTYWRNGGDAGIPTEIKWTLPKGITAGEIRWPLPVKEIDTRGGTSLFTYVYTNRVVLLVPLKLDNSLPLGPVTLTATGTWMECSSEICSQTGNDVSANLIIGSTHKPSPDAPMISEWQKKVPAVATAPGAQAYWSGEPPKDNTRGLIIAWAAPHGTLDFYPFTNANFEVQGATETLPANGTEIRIRKMVKRETNDWPAQIAGVLVESGHGYQTELPVQSAPPKESVNATSAVPAASLITMLFLAFLGGLILNVMPCVLPVIALKILGFVNQSKEEPRRVRQLGAVYGIGVLVSFAVLAMLAIGAQHAGGLANWGDAFRDPKFQVVLTILMTLIALNLFGVFEITLSGRALGAASELSAKPGFGGAFFNGVLATLLATPCTAPFLGVALAFAFTQPAYITVAVFLAAGFGLAFPFVAICLNPRLLKLLPKPGPWMQKFKVAMGFPMLATAVWLLWVYSRRENDVLWLGLFLVALALVAWIWGEFVQRGSRGRALAGAICLILLALDYGMILEGELHWRSPPETAATGIAWQAWSPEAVEKARQAGHPVLVDFTAKSCLTCQLNLAGSIDIPAVRAKLKQTGATDFKADYTFDDPAIARVLRQYNRSGVPLVLVYSKNASEEPQVLPTILTPAIVLDALDKATR